MRRRLSKFCAASKAESENHLSQAMKGILMTFPYQIDKIGRTGNGTDSHSNRKTCSSSVQSRVMRFSHPFRSHRSSPSFRHTSSRSPFRKPSMRPLNQEKKTHGSRQHAEVALLLNTQACITTSIKIKNAPFRLPSSIPSPGTLEPH